MSRFVRVLSLSLATLLMASACKTTPKRDPGLRPVPVDDGLTWLSTEQKKILAERGKPQALWARPLAVVMWVYCEKDKPSAVLEFDAYGQQMGATINGSRLLCTVPASGAAQKKAQAGDSLSFSEIMEELRTNYRLRHEAGRAQAGMSLAEAALSIQPRDLEALRLACGISVHLASNLRPGESRACVARKGLAWSQALQAKEPESAEARMQAVILRGLTLTTAKLKPAVLEEELKALMADLEHAIKLDPDYKQGLPRIVQAHLLLFTRPAGWEDELASSLQALKEQYPDSPYLALLCSDRAAIAGDKKRARKILQRLMRSLPAGTTDFAEGATLARWAKERIKALDGDLVGAPALIPERYPIQKKDR